MDQFTENQDVNPTPVVLLNLSDGDIIAVSGSGKHQLCLYFEREWSPLKTATVTALRKVAVAHLEASPRSSFTRVVWELQGFPLFGPGVRAPIFHFLIAY